MFEKNSFSMHMFIKKIILINMCMLGEVKNNLELGQGNDVNQDALVEI